MCLWYTLVYRFYYISNAYLHCLMFYIKTPKTVTVTGRKRILAVGTEVKKLGLDGGDDVIAYILRPEDELQMDMLIGKTGSKFHLLFSENPDLIVARTLTEAKNIKKETEHAISLFSDPSRRLSSPRGGGGRAPNLQRWGR